MKNELKPLKFQKVKDLADSQKQLDSQGVVSFGQSWLTAELYFEFVPLRVYLPEKSPENLNTFD